MCPQPAPNVNPDPCASSSPRTFLIWQVVEKALRILFTSHDLSAVKSYVLRQCEKVVAERAPFGDYIFAQASTVRRLTRR